jgi:hypothetical protein
MSLTIYKFKLKGVSKMAERDKNWLQTVMESSLQKGYLHFHWDLKLAYTECFKVDDPEDDDDHYREALIEALGALEAPKEQEDDFVQLIRHCFGVLSRRAGRDALIREVSERLARGYAFNRFQEMVAHWESLKARGAEIALEKDPEIIAAKRRLKKAEGAKHAAEHALRKNLTDWRYYEYEPIWGKEMSVTKFVDTLKQENKQLDWQFFVKGLEPKNAEQPTDLKDALSNIAVKPSIYWYPGSGMDFKPLILDVPNSPTKRRLFRVSEPDYSNDPILFWMNDHGSYFAEAPEAKSFKASYCWPIDKDEPEGEDEHYDKWSRYDAYLKIAEKREDYVYAGKIPVTLFTLNVQNKNQSSKNRPESGDTYLVIFSNTASHALFEEVIFPLRLNVVCTVLAAQGGFSSQLRGFEQYRDIPKLLHKCEDELGPVDLYLLDDQAHDGSLKRPNSAYIRHYEYIGGPVRIGWYPCRAFGRPVILPFLTGIGSRVHVAMASRCFGVNPPNAMFGRL